MTTENRYYPRQNINFLASIQTDNEAWEVLVKDMSIGGMRLQARAKPPSLHHNQEVVVHIPFISDVSGYVCWQEEDIIGVCFECCPTPLESFVESILPLGRDITTAFKA